MCGRFTSLTPPDELAEIFSAEMSEELREAAFVRSFNVAPSTMVMAVALTRTGARRLGRLRWGLVPSWSKEASGAGHVNARSETVDVKPSFRDSFKGRRCIIPMSGYYEWRTAGTHPASGEKGGPGREPKQAVYVTRRDGAPMAVAGLWSVWTPPNADSETSDVHMPSEISRRLTLKTCCIVTREANDLLSPVHDRMPVVLEQETWPLWLGEGADWRSADLRAAMTQDRSDLEYVDVGSQVNSVRNNGPDLILPVH